MVHVGKPKMSKIRAILRVLGIAFAGFLVLCSLLVILISFVVWRVIERTHFDIAPATVQKAVRYMVVATLKDGEREQKLQTIDELAKIGPDAKPFVTGLMEAASDDDAEVRGAAINALRVIDPSALDRLDELENM